MSERVLPPREPQQGIQDETGGCYERPPLRAGWTCPICFHFNEQPVNPESGPRLWSCDDPTDLGCGEGPFVVDVEVRVFSNVHKIEGFEYGKS